MQAASMNLWVKLFQAAIVCHTKINKSFLFALGYAANKIACFLAQNLL